MEEKLKLAGRAYGNGCTCSQAVFCAFARDMGMDETLAYKIMEGFGGGFGGMQEVYGALCVAAAVISYCTSSGSMDGASKEKTRWAIRQAGRSTGGSTARSAAARSCTAARREPSSAA